jgi:hypothetical protein
MYDIIKHVPCLGCQKEICLIIPVDEEIWEDHCWSCSIELGMSTVFHIIRMPGGAFLWWPLPDEMIPRLYLSGHEPE